MRSESTRAFGQPRLTKPTLGLAADMRVLRRGPVAGGGTGKRGGKSGAIIRARPGPPPPARRPPPRRMLGRPTPPGGRMAAISLRTRHGRIGGWEAKPHGPPRGSLVIVQE